MSEAKDDLIARRKPSAWRAVKALRHALGWTALADALSEYVAAAASLTEQVARLTRERDDALATISLLQSQCRKQQEHDTAIIEGLTLDVNRYAYERDNAREERDKAERRSEAFWKPQVEAAEAKVSRLWAENAAQNRHGPIKGIRKMSDAALQLLLSNTSEGGNDE